MGEEEERLGHRCYRNEQLRQSRDITATTPTSRGEESRRATTDGHYQVVLSLLCLWPYGNSLIVSSHSEFYQCHTQNRSRYHATSEAGPEGHDWPSERSFPNKAPDPC